jgi:hypothetical protein
LDGVEKPWLGRNPHQAMGVSINFENRVSDSDRFCILLKCLYQMENDYGVFLFVSTGSFSIVSFAP